MTQEEA